MAVSTEHRDFRQFELVKIAFEKALAGRIDRTDRPFNPVDIAKAVVEYADAVLAEMEMDVPDAKEIERRARKLAGTLLTDLKITMEPVLRDLRAAMRDCFKRELTGRLLPPTPSAHMQSLREGFITARGIALDCIDEAIAKARKAEPEAENGN